MTNRETATRKPPRKILQNARAIGKRDAFGNFVETPRVVGRVRYRRRVRLNGRKVSRVTRGR